MSKVKEHGIIFSGPMVRALLDGTKTQTRRIVKFPRSTGAFVCVQGFWREKPDGWWPFVSYDGESMDDGNGCETPIMPPHGEPGDRLYMKEAHWLWGKWTPNGKTKTGRKKWRFSQVGTSIRFPEHKPAATAKRDGECGWVYRHARYMRREHSRLTLEITDVRVQLVQEISEEDARAEGVERPNAGQYESGPIKTYRTGFVYTWNSLHGSDAWERNDWVWAYTFRRIPQERSE